jgi:hypothetical protein
MTERSVTTRSGPWRSRAAGVQGSAYTGFRVMLHMGNNGLLTPPTPAETIAEATVPASFQLRR